MPFPQKLFFYLISVNALIVLMFLAASHRYQPDSKPKLVTTQDLFTAPDSLNEKNLQEDLRIANEQINTLTDLLKTTQLELQKALRVSKNALKTSNSLKKPKVLKTPFQALVDPHKKPPKFSRESNPFFMLGAYPKPDIPLPYENGVEKTFYDKINYGLFNDADYCERVDYYNLAHPENIFEKKNFFTDFAKNTVVRHDIIPEIGKDVMKQISLFRKKQETKVKKIE